MTQRWSGQKVLQADDGMGRIVSISWEDIQRHSAKVSNAAVCIVLCCHVALHGILTPALS